MKKGNNYLGLEHTVSLIIDHQKDRKSMITYMSYQNCRNLTD